MAMYKTIIFLAAETLLLHAAGSAAVTTGHGGGNEIPQNWCYCLQFSTPTPFSPIPYYPGSFPQLSPGCSGIKFDAGRKGAVEELYSCEDVRRCWQRPEQDAQVKKGMETARDQRLKLLDAHCRKPSPSPPYNAESCRRNREEITRGYRHTIAMVDVKIRSERKTCFAKAPKGTSAKYQLRGPDREARLNAAFFLALRDTTTIEAIPILIDAVGRYDTGCKAIAALGNYGSAANAAVPALAGISTEYSNCPASSTITLEQIGTPDARAALELLREWERKWNARENKLFQALSDRDPVVRGNAARELHNIALESRAEREKPAKLREITAVLKPLLSDPQKPVRYRVASYLAHVDTASVEALPVLIEAVGDNEVADYSCIAIAALGGYGRAAKAAVPILSDPGVMERHEYFRAPNPCSPAAALERIGTREALAAIKSLRSRELERKRIATREALAALKSLRSRELERKWSKHEKRLLVKAWGAVKLNERESAMRELRSIALKSPEHKRKNILAALQLLLRYTDKTGRPGAASRLISISFTATGAVLKEHSPYASPGSLHPGSFGTARADAAQAFDKLTNGKGSTYFRLKEYTAAPEQLRTPEAMAAPGPMIKTELLVHALMAPFAFLVFIPPLAPLTVLFFAWLFWRSRAREKEGRKLIYQPLLIPILGWLYISYVVMFELDKHGSFRQIYGADICLWLSVITTLAGLIPWCVSWLLRRLRERRRSA